MKNQKGITLISLIITIILIIMLASIGTYTGIESFNNMRVQAFVSKMIALQEKVNVFCDQHTISEMNTYGIEYSVASTEAQTVLSDVIVMGEAGQLKSWYSVDNSTSNYRYFDTNAIATVIGLQDFDVGVWINPTTRNIIAIEGVEVDDVKYYRQYDLSGGQELSEPVTITDFVLDTNIKTYDNKADINLSKVFAKITCNTLQAGTNTTIGTQIFTNTDTITVTESGKYELIAVDYSGSEELTQTATISVTIVNKPILAEGMVPVKLNSSGELETTTADDPEWYNYDSSEKRWANVQLKDGSYYVWIPRFAYKKDSSSISIKFLSNTSNGISTDGKALDSTYKVAPAFQNGVSNGFQNGEWDKEITGFWVAKYEATIKTVSSTNVPQSILSTTQSKVTPQNAFIYCRNMESVDTFFDETKAVTLNTDASSSISNFGTYQTDNNNIDTHLAKNSEYGAVAYLTYSDYGNTSISTQSSDYPGYTSGTTLASNETTTTGNKSGVYGMAGGPAEITASGYTIDTVYNKENVSTKYATTYNNGSDVSITFGDGIADCPITLSSSSKPSSAKNLYLRGGSNSTGQLFAYSSIASTATGCFRPIIIVEY